MDQITRPDTLDDMFVNKPEIPLKFRNVRLVCGKSQGNISESPFNIPISPGANLSPAFVQTTPAYKRTAKSTPYSVSRSWNLRKAPYTYTVTDVFETPPSGILCLQRPDFSERFLNIFRVTVSRYFLAKRVSI